MKLPLIPTLLVIFGALVGLASWQARSTAMPITPVATPLVYTLVFEEMPLRSILGIRLTSPSLNASLTLLRDSTGEWQIPAEFSAIDAETATLIARTFTLLTYFDSFSFDDGQDLSQYGFIGGQPLTLSAEIILTDGTTHAIQVGDLSGTGSAYYALADGHPRLYLIEPQAIEFLVQHLRKEST
ncbi:MAG: DUF4340 domain-containing protein [Phototrophicaceae bacterium]